MDAVHPPVTDAAGTVWTWGRDGFLRAGYVAVRDGMYQYARSLGEVETEFGRTNTVGATS